MKMCRLVSRLLLKDKCFFGMQLLLTRLTQSAIIAFGRAVLFFLSLFVFALAARKRTTEKWGSTMLPQANTSLKWPPRNSCKWHDLCGWVQGGSRLANLLFRRFRATGCPLGAALNRRKQGFLGGLAAL